MRLQKIVLAVLVCLLPSAAPVVAHALQVVLTATTTTNPTPTTVTLGPGTTVDTKNASNVTIKRTTTITLVTPLNVGGFTFTRTNTASPATVKIEQSGTPVRIIWNNVTIKAPPPTTTPPLTPNQATGTPTSWPSITSLAALKAPCPCTIKLETSSQTTDFFKKIAINTTYSAGGSIAGTFIQNPAFTSRNLNEGTFPNPTYMVGGTTKTTISASPAGDTWNLEFFAAGDATLAPLSGRPINKLADSGGGTGKSLPYSCSGTTGCTFTATEANGGAYNLDTVTENIKLTKCAVSPCFPTAAQRLVFTFTFPGDGATLPLTWGTGGELIGDVVPTPFSTFSVTEAEVTLGAPATNKDDSLRFRANWFLGSNNDGIACLDEEVGFAFGTFSSVFLQGTFHESPNGACEAKLTNPQGDWHIVINKNQIAPDVLEFQINALVKKAELKDIVTPIQTVSAQLVIGNDAGKTLVTPEVK